MAKIDKGERGQIEVCKNVIQALFANEHLHNYDALTFEQICRSVNAVRCSLQPLPRIKRALRDLVRYKVLRSRMSRGKRLWEANI